VDENPWCFQCNEAHWKHECPYSSGGHQQINNIDHFIEGPQINIAIEEHQECYNPKLHHTCSPGIRPTHIPSLPKHLLKNLFENPLG
jgi:hypothetical protein